MTRLLLMMVIALVCAVVAGCSSPPVTNGRDASDQVVHKANTALPVAEGDTNGTPVSSSGELPPYKLVVGLTGKITSIGASTTTNLVARVATEFRRMYPDVTVHATASLTSIGPSALLESRADIVPMSRPLAPEEVQSFTKKYGYPPTEIKVAADALAVYVEKRNPVPGLTLGQLDSIFSRTQRRGGISIEKWDQLGLTGEWTDRPITLYGYGPEDSDYQIFQQQVLDGGAFRLSLRVEGGGSSIVQGVAADPGAIGFASIFFACKRVRPVPLAGADGRFYVPTEDNVRSHRYPLIRFLYICVNKPPLQPLGGPAAEFLRFLLSREGQQIVTAGGNIPLDAATVEQGRRTLAE
jgi:phosphate transport system substrate-binding protein